MDFFGLRGDGEVDVAGLSGKRNVMVQRRRPGPWKFGPPPSPSTWTRFVLDTYVADSGSMVVREGAQMVVNATNVQTATDDRDEMFVELGFYDNDSAAAQANFDNVILDWH